MHVIPLFPTAVGSFDLQPGLSVAEKKFIFTQEFQENTLNTSSKNTKLLDAPELVRLKAFAEAAANTYLQQVHSPATDVSLYVTQSWANVTEPGQAHHQHSHPNSFISGVIYLEAEPEDNIQFVRHQGSDLRVESKTFNEYNSSFWWLPAVVGRLYLFPSNLQHMVKQRGGSRARVSLAFNTFFKGTLGSVAELSELQL